MRDLEEKCGAKEEGTWANHRCELTKHGGSRHQETRQGKIHKWNNEAWKVENPGNQPCANCEAEAGTFLERGFDRCKKCGYPGQ